MANKKKLRKKKLAFEKIYRQRYGIFKVLETEKIDVSFGTLLIPAGDTIFAPATLPIKKVLTESITNMFRPLERGFNLDNTSLLIIRYGGIGDLLCTIPGILKLKQRWKNLHIGFITSPSYSSVLKAFPSLVNQIFPVVCAAKDIRPYKHIIVLDDVVEKSPDYATNTLQHIYADALTIDRFSNNNDEVKEFNVIYQKHKDSPKQGIGIQYQCDALNRNYNIDKTCAVINQLLEKYPNEKIFLLGRANDNLNTDYILSQAKEPNRVFPNKYNLLETMELISQLKLVIGPDSSMLHIAGVCGTPIVGLFGPFPSNLRISNYKGSGITGETSCSPCFRHSPENFCVHTTNEGLCVNSIEPKNVVDVVEIVLNNNYK